MSAPASAGAGADSPRMPFSSGGSTTRIRRRRPPGGTRTARCFRVKPRSFLTAPLCWLVAHVFLRNAVLAHNRAVQEELSRA